MSLASLETTINGAFDARETVTTATKGEVREAVDHALDLLDKGEARVAARAADGKWIVNQWLKKAVLLSFRLNDMSVIPGGPGNAVWWKGAVEVPGLGREPVSQCRLSGRAGCDRAPLRLHRKNAVLMPSFVNLGAYVDKSTMVDTWCTVGSCAQIGKRFHISGGAGIGGVSETAEAGPVIIEDDCFIGARSEVARRHRSQGRCAVDGRFSRRFDQDRRPCNRRDLMAKCRNMRLWCRERCRASR